MDSRRRADGGAARRLLTYERLFRKLARRVKAKTPEELSAKRKIMAAFVATLQRETRVRYEPGFAPGS
jgi:hypothetical protein